VTSGPLGYTSQIPSQTYSVAPIVITTQPSVSPTCEFKKAVTVVDNGGNTLWNYRLMEILGVP
jgi:hypothetical protein